MYSTGPWALRARGDLARRKKRWTVRLRADLTHVGRRSCRVAAAADPPAARAFTLIELMVVVGIIALVMTISIPSIYRQLHPDSMAKAVDDVLEACRYARGRAILEGTITELVFHPGDRVVEVVPTALSGRDSADESGGERMFSPGVSGDDWRMPERGSSGGGGAIFTVRLSPKITVEGLGINGLDYTEDPVSRVRFYPNGTSDAMSVVLLSERNERRNITLEVVTALADVEVDPGKFRAR